MSKKQTKVEEEEIEDEDIELSDEAVEEDEEVVDEDVEIEEEGGSDGDGGEEEPDYIVETDDIPLDDEINKSRQKEFKVLSAEELVNNQQKEVIHVSEVCGCPVGVAGACLRAYRWNKEKLLMDFVEDKQKVCKKAGVNLDEYIVRKGNSNETMTCSVCYDDYPGDQMLGLVCKHFLCRICWKDYLEVAISDGPTCLLTKCPYQKCSIFVDETLVKELVSPKSFSLYSKYLARSFVDDNPRIRWCPAPDCGRAVFCPESITDTVMCSCGNKFCFKCSREAHAPSSCEELTMWLKKEKDESETATWLAANTKDCPQCKKSIEKNGGCNHMTCSMCKYEFCWVCSDDWKTHGSQTGGYYKCNKYKPEDLRKKTGEDSRESARAALEKYMHYYKRYSNHDRSQKFEKQLREKAEEKMKELQQINKYSSWVDVEYIQKGVEQLIECRRSLKYTYVYGYYMKDGPEKDLFEYMQEDLERVTERLSEILEGPVEKFIRDEIISTTKTAERRLSHLMQGCKQGLVQSAILPGTAPATTTASTKKK